MAKERASVSLPEFSPDGILPPGIHAATLAEIRSKYDNGSEARHQQLGLLSSVVEAARRYRTIKRVLVWGSFVTAKTEPNDLDYSAVVSVDHRTATVAPEHGRFFVGSAARRFYGVDVNYLIIMDYPLDYYVEKLDFLCHTRTGQPCGLIEISLRGEFPGETV
jgi:hypothetical protein